MLVVSGTVHVAPGTGNDVSGTVPLLSGTETKNLIHLLPFIETASLYND